MAKPKSEYPPNVPEIREGIVPMWHAGYYDGILSGVCMYQDMPHWFDCKKQYDSRELRRSVYRSFWLYRLTDDQWNDIKYWHDEFRLHVGSNCDYSWNDEKQAYLRPIGGQTTSYAYAKEMYYDRYEAWILEHSQPTKRINKKTQTVGWAIYDVVLGRPWVEWRRPKKQKVVTNVSEQEEDT